MTLGAASLLVGIWAGLLTVIQIVFHALEKHLQPDVVERIRRWLLDPATIKGEWVSHFEQLFETLFGPRHFTWHCLSRSCLASLAVQCLLLLFWISRYPQEASHTFGSAYLGTFTLAFAMTTLVYSFPCDYFSLYKTRRLIQWVGIRPSFGKLASAFLLDVVLTCLVLLLGLVYLRYLYAPAFGLSFADLVTWEGVSTTFTLRAFPNTSWYPHGIFFYAAYFGSVWLWLYGVAAFLLRTLSRLEASKVLIAGYLKVSEHPVGALGTLLMLLLSVPFGLKLGIGILGR